MRLLAAIEPDQVKNAAVAVIVILAILVIVVLRFIQKLILKLMMMAALVGAGVFLYTERDDLDACQRTVRESAFQDCDCTFAGFEITVPGCDRVPGA